jgi:DNA modification methylase
MITTTRTVTVNDRQGWQRLAPCGYCRREPGGDGNPPPEVPRRQLLIGDAIEQLRTLPTSSIDCVITSPPFYMLRNYGVDQQIGLERDVDGWVERLRSVMGEVARVLKPVGSLWLNLGDSYSRHLNYGAAPKGLLCAPERLLLALSRDGWLVRNKVIWAKPNPMPASVADRLNTTYEVVYFLVRQPRYEFNLDAIREPHRTKGARSASTPLGKAPTWAGPLAGSQDGLRRARAAGQPGHPLGKNPGDVWSIATQGFRGAHFATFPEQLIYRPLLATCPEAICTRCGLAWRRQATVHRDEATAPAGRDDFVWRDPSRWLTYREAGPLEGCGCGADTQSGVVLDPFFGSGTVGVVAERLGRDWVGIELNPSYGELALERLEAAREGVINNKERRAA